MKSAQPGNLSRPGRLAGVVVACLATVLAVERLLAQDVLPPARDVVTRHVAAIGGESAYKAVKSLHATGRYEMPASKMVGQIELYQARPDKQLYRVTMPGIGRVENGYNGKVGWSASPVVGPELLSGRQLTEAADDAWFDATLHAADRLREMVTVGRTDFDGRPAFKIRVVTRAGTEQTEYFDVETGLQRGAEASRATSQGIVPTTNIMRDYRKFGDLLQPTTFVQRALGFEEVEVITIETCEYNTVADSVFNPPAEVQALIKK